MFNKRARPIAEKVFAKKTRPIEQRHMISEEVAGFIIDRRAKGLSQNTVDFYSSQLKLLTDYIAKHDLDYVEEVDARLLREIFIEMKEDGHNSGGVHALFRTIRTFFNWWMKEVDPDNYQSPMRTLEAPKNNTDVIAGVPESDFMAMVKACDKTFYGQRDKAIMMFLYDTGVRVSELCDLNYGDLDVHTGTTRVRHGKGNKKRMVFAGATTLREILRYMRLRPNVGIEEPLFAHKGGSRFDREGIRTMLVKRANDAGVEDIPSPHDFRRAFATQSLRNGANLKAVRDQLGHSTYAIVDRYARLNTDDLREQHKNSSPVDKIK